MSAKTKSGKPRAYLLKGDDELRKEKFLGELLQQLVSPDFADFDLERLDGGKATADGVITGLNMPPFGSEQRVVLLKHANKMDAEEQKKLAARLSKTPTASCLIIVNPSVERTDGKVKKGSEIVGELSKAVRAVGETKEFGGEKNKDKENLARSFAQSLLSENGKTIDTQALTLFLRRVGADFATVKSEVDKLTTYAGESSRITAHDVSAVTTESPEEKVFKMVDAVAARNSATALRLLDELFAIGDNPDGDAPRTLSVLARQFRFIWQVKQLQAAGVRTLVKSEVPEGVRRELPSDPNVLDTVGRQSWMQDKLADQARRFKLADLARCFELIARSDRMLKGIEGNIEDPRMIMELLVIDLASGR